MKIAECPSRIKGRCDVLLMGCSFLPTMDRKVCPVHYETPKPKEPKKRKAKRLTW